MPDLPLQTKAQREARRLRVAKRYPTVAARQAAKAKRVATLFAPDQKSLDDLLKQFSPHMQAHVLKRLIPHLLFEPK